MSNYVTGTAVKVLREKKGYTQKQLADRLGVSDKAVSKWETGRGLPDLSLAELLSGEQITNANRSANPKRGKFYLCPVCGNVIHAMGEGAFHCCGVALPPLEAEEADGAHAITLSEVDGEWYVRADHPMEKGHFLTFFAQATDRGVEIVKLWPEQVPEARFTKRGVGSVLYACCNRHGLFRVK